MRKAKINQKWKQRITACLLAFIMCLPLTEIPTQAQEIASIQTEYTQSLKPGYYLTVYSTSKDFYASANNLAQETQSVYMAVSSDGKTFYVLNNNGGVIFAKSGSGRITSPQIYKRGNGFAVIAPDAEESNGYHIFTSADGVHYYDETFGSGTAEYDTVSTLKKSEFRLMMKDGNLLETDDTITLGNAVELTETEYAYIVNKLGTVVNTGMEPLADVSVKSGDNIVDILEEKYPSANAVYSDGSMQKFQIDWSEAANGLDLSKAGIYTVKGKVIQTKFLNNGDIRFVEGIADPYIYYDEASGYYYMTGSYLPAYGDNIDNMDVTQMYDRIVLRRGRTLEELQDRNRQVTIWKAGNQNYTSVGGTDEKGYRFVWAPELHRVGDKWVIYFAENHDRSSSYSLRCHALILDGGKDPYETALASSEQESQWRDYQVRGSIGDISALSETFSTDMTYFEDAANGQSYVAWGAQLGGANLFIAKVDKQNPWLLDSEIVQVSAPQYGWEKVGSMVNEKPAVLQKNGKIFMCYSAAEGGSGHAVGMMTAEQGVDLLNPASWTKNPYPLLTSRDVDGETDLGYNSFMLDKVGNVIFVFQARPISHNNQQCGTYTGGLLNDPCCYAHLRRVHWAKDGTPVLKMAYEEELTQENQTVSVRVTVSEALAVSDFKYNILDDGTLEITGYNGTAENAIIPEAIGGRRATAIGRTAFLGCSSLKSIELPESLTSIGEYAFWGCSSLESIELPESLTSIGKSTFYGCSSLTSITILDRVTSISEDAFERCDNLIIFGKKGSYAQTYAENYRIPFSIIGESQDEPRQIADCETTLSSVSYTYDGSEKKPTVTVKDGLTTLTSGTDYLLTYSNNINVGVATVTIAGIGNYTGTTSKFFTISARRRSFLWGQDNWNFNNSSYQGYFSSGKYIDQINSTYLNKLKNNLTNSEYRAIFNNSSGWLYDRFAGSCYGMSSTNLLAMENYLPYSDYGSGAANLSQLRYPLASDSISSLITYYQMLQVKSVIQQQYRTVPNKTNKENIQNIIALLDENNTVLIGFKKDGWGGHAVLAYGYEYGSYTWNGISYQGCIKICDPNCSKEYNAQCNIYFNANTYNWTIPYYSSAPVTSVSGARFNYVGADVNEINYGGYLSGTSNVNISDYVARIDAAAVSENRSVTKVSEVDGNYFPQNNAPGDIVEDYSYVLGGESTGTIGYNLYDAESAYKLSQNNAEKLQLSIDYEDCYLEGGSAAGSDIIFDNDGYVSVSGESADYNISMTFDEDYPTDWFTIQIDGRNSNEASLEKTDTGYILSGDNLENVEVSANNKHDSAHARFTTEYQSVYIYEIDRETIGVNVDTDKNGTYETTLTTEDAHQYDSEWKTDGKSHWKECKCGEKSELSAHEFKWVIDKNATVLESGLKHEECAVCGYKRNENTVIAKQSSIPTKGQKLTDKKTGVVYKVTSAKTKGGTIEYTKPLNNKAANISIPSTVKIDGISYKVTSIAANVFKNNKIVTKVIIGSNITSIGKNSFSGCSKLKTLTIGSNVVSIGDNAFLNCTSLQTVTIPAKVKKIGKQAFCGCKKLSTVKINAKKLVSKDVGSKAFAKLDPKAAVKVPSSCLKSYKKLLQKKGLNGKKQKIKK